ncbi:MAG: cation:dicarboxylase symporter family transporter, partial [Syntrophomonas sp.]
RYGTVLTVTLGTVFMAQVYKMPLSFEQCIFILCMSVLAGIAAAGAPGIVALSLISMVMTPLGLPSTVAITLLIAIHAIIAPINTVINAYMSSTAAILIIDDSNINISGEVEQHALRHGDGSRAM